METENANAETENANAETENTRRRLVLPVITLVMAATYVAAYLPRHFVALDEGELGQAVDRVLAGQLPHRDFDDIWSGGAALYHALAAHLLGNQLFTFRLALFALTLPWLAALYALARRVASPRASAAAVLVAVAWSIPNYPAAMPSWYVLFFATFGALAVCRFIETNCVRWLFAAGACGGIAILAKVVGLYYLAAVALVLLTIERQRGRLSHTDVAPETDRTDRTDRAYSGLITIGLLAFTAAIARLAMRVPSTTGGPLLQCALPVALLTGALIHDEWREPRDAPSFARIRTLASMLFPLMAGAAIPIALFLIPYTHTHSVSAWLEGVFITPQRRFDSASLSPPGFEAILPALAWPVVLGMFHVKHRRALATPSIVGVSYATVWLAIQQAPLGIVLAGTLSSRRSPYLWLFLSLTALCSLIRIPYAAPAYTFYYAPLAVLAVLALPGPRPFLLPLAVFLTAFAVLFVNPGHYTAEGDPIPDHGFTHLTIPRAGTLLVPAHEAALYEALVDTVNAHIPRNAPLYAAPDCPQVEYLTHRPNPTPTFLDFLDDPSTHDARALQAINSPLTAGAVIYHRPHASAPVDSIISTALRTQFPDSATIGSTFTVRWRRGTSQETAQPPAPHPADPTAPTAQTAPHTHASPSPD